MVSLAGGDADAVLHDEFIHLPTYLALGTLSFILCEMPGVTKKYHASALPSKKVWNLPHIEDWQVTGKNG